jgi:large subunit ribosomal protein L15
MAIRTHKRKKSSRNHGRGMGTAGWGSRKKHRSSGNRGGIGMSGTGKRADHKKTLVQKLYGHEYFGKQGITSRGTKKDKRDRINLKQIQENINKIGKKGSKGWEIDLKNYKILSDGEVKEKLIIKAREASKLAIEKVTKAGGEIILQTAKTKKEEKNISEAD